MATSETTVDNGVNVQALLDAREALTAAPEGAKFEWRATCEWKNGTHSHSTVEGFFGLGEEQKHVTRSPSMPTTRRYSRPRTKAPRRSSTYSSAWSAA